MKKYNILLYKYFIIKIKIETNGQRSTNNFTKKLKYRASLMQI